MAPRHRGAAAASRPDRPGSGERHGRSTTGAASASRRFSARVRRTPDCYFWTSGLASAAAWNSGPEPAPRGTLRAGEPMGIGASKPRDKDTKLKDRSGADDNDNDLDRRGVVVAPNGNVYASSLHLLGASQQAQVGAVVQSEAADLNAVGAAQTANAAVATGAGLHSAPPSTKAKAAKITLLLLGGGAIGAGITTALFLAGVIKVAANIVVVTVPGPVRIRLRLRPPRPARRSTPRPCSPSPSCRRPISGPRARP